jgi:hypothetical protein
MYSRQTPSAHLFKYSAAGGDILKSIDKHKAKLIYQGKLASACATSTFAIAPLFPNG